MRITGVRYAIGEEARGPGSSRVIIEGTPEEIRSLESLLSVEVCVLPWEVANAGNASVVALWTRLNVARILAGLSSRGLAQELACSPSTITRWSQGKSPSAAVILATLRWLAAREDEVPL